MDLQTYFETEFIPKMRKQLEEDDKRWRNEYKNRPRHGQEKRIFNRLWDYYDDFVYSKKPIPWLKVVGESVIAMFREDHPELFK